MSDTEVKSIADIKKEKKLKKQLAPEVLETRKNNMKKAIQARKDKYEEKNKLKLIEYNINDLINNNDDSSIEDNEKKEILKKSINKNNDKQENPINNNIVNNDYKVLLDHITNINKKVEKLYIMKKNKPIKQSQPLPVYVNTKSDKSDDLLNAIRNKMLNN